MGDATNFEIRKEIGMTFYYVNSLNDVYAGDVIFTPAQVPNASDIKHVFFAAKSNATAIETETNAFVDVTHATSAIEISYQIPSVIEVISVGAFGFQLQGELFDAQKVYQLVDESNVSGQFATANPTLLALDEDVEILRLTFAQSTFVVHYNAERQQIRYRKFTFATADLPYNLEVVDSQTLLFDDEVLKYPIKKSQRILLGPSKLVEELHTFKINGEELYFSDDGQQRLISKNYAHILGLSAVQSVQSVDGKTRLEWRLLTEKPSPWLHQSDIMIGEKRVSSFEINDGMAVVAFDNAHLQQGPLRFISGAPIVLSHATDFRIDPLYEQAAVQILNDQFAVKMDDKRQLWIVDVIKTPNVLIEPSQHLPKNLVTTYQQQLQENTALQSQDVSNFYVVDQGTWNRLLKPNAQFVSVLNVRFTGTQLVFDHLRELDFSEVALKNYQGEEYIAVKNEQHVDETGALATTILTMPAVFAERESRYDVVVKVADTWLTIRQVDFRLHDFTANYSVSGPQNDDFEGTWYVATNGKLGFVMKTAERLAEEVVKYKPYVTEIKMQRSRVKMTVAAPVTQLYDAGVLVLKNRRYPENVYTIEPDAVAIVDKNLMLTYVFDLKNIEWTQFFWDVYLTFQRDGQMYRSKVAIRNRRDEDGIIRILRRASFSYQWRDGDHIAYPYAAGGGAYGDYLAFTYRPIGEYETWRYKINEWIAAFLYKKVPGVAQYLKKQQAWLIYEKYSQSAQDNSFYFFKYMFEHRPEKKVYYVIDKKSPDYRFLKPMKKRVLNFMSVKHLLWAMGNELLVSSESKAHGYAWRVNRGPIRPTYNLKPYVFLQHGVTGMKRHPGVFSKGSLNSSSVFITTSEFEKKVIVDYFGYREDEVAVTGFARWDYLHEMLSQPEFKQDGSIFLMPTWRNWLEEVEDSEFLASEYFTRYSSLLKNAKLHEALETFDMTLNVYIHPKFAEYASLFTSNNPRIKIILFGEQPINQLIARSSILITDYSSVAWEELYQGKPAIFYQFDQDQYLEEQGSYMDLNTELFGPVVKDEPQLVTAIIDQLNRVREHDLSEIEAYQKRYFAFIDQHNSERIYQAILKKFPKRN
ncbi:MAG TPA: CDP-glycerol glycerophosphotransferase family protein [Lactobacillaceae bacterium]